MMTTYEDGCLALDKQHSIENHIGRDLSEREIDDLGAYLADDPADTSDSYLTALFELH